MLADRLHKFVNEVGASGPLIPDLPSSHHHLVVTLVYRSSSMKIHIELHGCEGGESVSHLFTYTLHQDVKWLNLKHEDPPILVLKINILHGWLYYQFFWYLLNKYLCVLLGFEVKFVIRCCYHHRVTQYFKYLHDILGLLGYNAKTNACRLWQKTLIPGRGFSSASTAGGGGGFFS